MPTSSNPINKRKGPLPSLQHFIASNPETFFRNILNTSDDLQFLLDEHLQLAWFNKTAHELYKKATGKRLTHKVMIIDLLKPNELEELFGYIAQVYQGKNIQFDYKFERDHTYWINIALYPFIKDFDMVAGVYGVCRDITVQKDKLREISILSQVPKQTSNAVVIVDRDGVIYWTNEEFTKLTGYSAGELIGKQARKILPGPETDTEILDTVAAHRQKGTPFKGKVLIYTKAGKKTWIQFHSHPIRDDEGRTNAYFYMLTDVSETNSQSEKQLEGEIEHHKEITRLILKAEEDERNRLGRELHDNINQILAAIKLQLAYCLDHYSKSKPIIEKSHIHIRDVIEEIRKLSHHLVMPRFSESTLQQELIKLVEDLPDGSMIDLELAKLNEDNISSAHKEAFFRIIQEQLNNIIKHAKANKIVIKMESTAKTIRLAIEDNGIGFDPLKKRNGIGITNILNRVELEGGQVKIRTRRGRGCSLIVAIPVELSK